MSSLISDSDKLAYAAAFQLNVDTWIRTLIVYQEPLKTVIISDPNYNPYESYNQNNTNILNTPVFSTISGRIMYDKDQELAYARPYAGRGVDEGQIKLKNQSVRSVRVKVDISGFNLLQNAKKVEIDGQLFDFASLPRPHGLFTPTYFTFYYNRST